MPALLLLIAGLILRLATTHHTLGDVFIVIAAVLVVLQVLFMGKAIAEFKKLWRDF